MTASTKRSVSRSYRAVACANLFDRLPGTQGTVYDMAQHAEDVDRILDTGRIPFGKVQRTSKGGLANLNLGEHTFTLLDGTNHERPVIAVDTAPAIIVIIDGEQHLMPLVRRQTQKRPNADGTKTVYGIWTIPNHPAVPGHLRDASTLIRQNSTDYERKNGTRRTRALRPIPENDPDFISYGRREDNESIHHNIKVRLPNGRARGVGLTRQRINFHAYQLQLALTTVIAWHYRTDADLTRWFGQWRPPNRQRLALAA